MKGFHASVKNLWELGYIWNLDDRDSLLDKSSRSSSGTDDLESQSMQRSRKLDYAFLVWYRNESSLLGHFTAGSFKSET